MKVGIMGGTFNPVHNGHLILAENAYEQIGLDNVIFMPTKNPPHKNITELVSEEHRYNMVRLAVMENPHFTLSDMELSRKGVTYTADTLSILKDKNPDDSYYFIVGADSFFMLQTWKDPQTIFNLSTIIVAGRDRINQDDMEQQLNFLVKTYHANVEFLDMPNIDISSAMIRERIANNQSVKYYVPDSVWAYIIKHYLYTRILR
ncbi:nicotinate-nucleotide adenylyltransferase [Mobilitalea sibirica]|uniref:Probable nicotinate-nucleotide adenylyltransferase n=1 Tax=Mobilitalea sibirica TaxID=1462919 RepID=A0A8J7HCH4_9FIRM|nr:nicotinate-nucleotide adenylyltransferase [Mobilitalea sibirica]MBH1940972.1 nicotinate-nucleotide adenylyltransferase [Mobilitalea sibirica]